MRGTKYIQGYTLPILICESNAENTHEQLWTHQQQSRSIRRTEDQRPLSTVASKQQPHSQTTDSPPLPPLPPNNKTTQQKFYILRVHTAISALHTAPNCAHGTQIPTKIIGPVNQHIVHTLLKFSHKML